MSKFIDLTGHRYGRLVVIERAENGKNCNARFLCQCDCGNKKIIYSSYLRRGETTSCGCFQKERASEIHKTHGLSRSRLYTVWKDMKQCCLSPNSKDYKYYGGRGITICDEWLDFQNFYDWAIESGYKEEITESGYNYWTLERIDNDGNFEPDNCCWANRTAQMNNIRTNRLITDGESTLTLAQTARKKGISRITIGARISRYGWDTETAISTLPEKRNRALLEYKGERFSASEMSKKYNININTFRGRLHKGWSIEKIIETPVKKRTKRRTTKPSCRVKR